MTVQSRPDEWPAIPYEAWRETQEAVHLWTQIVGKVRLACVPWLNHGWHVTLALSARGLSTGLIPDPRGGFDMEFDFIDHRLTVRTADGGVAAMALKPQ